MIVNYQEGPPEPVVIDMGWMHGIVAADVPVVIAAACPYSLIGPRGSAETMVGEDERASRAQGCEIGAG